MPLNVNELFNHETYNEYKNKIIDLLIENRTWEEGVWRATGKSLAHILPVDYSDDPTLNRNNRADAIYNYVNLNCKKCLGKKLIDLHQFAHHLTSSQQLCMKFFSELIDDNRCTTKEMVAFIKSAFDIDIHVGTECRFEYTERRDPSYMFDSDKDGNLVKAKGKYEGTSFDSHIKDMEIPVEIYFEIKFTEQGFKKAEEYKRHLVKAMAYLRIAPLYIQKLAITSQDFLKLYQIYRNIIRAKENSNKYVVFISFISDGNNPTTAQDQKMMEDLHLPQNIIFRTWQQLIPIYSFDLPIQLKAIKKYK